MFLRKSVLKICSKFTGEHPCRSAILIKLLCNFYYVHTYVTYTDWLSDSLRSHLGYLCGLARHCRTHISSVKFKDQIILPFSCAHTQICKN